jgi:hypothetical protein
MRLFYSGDNNRAILATRQSEEGLFADQYVEEMRVSLENMYRPLNDDSFGLTRVVSPVGVND